MALSSLDAFSYDISLSQYDIVIVVAATYGEGDPTDDAMQFWSWLSGCDCDCDFTQKNTMFAVFGCGNSSYQYFNAVAKTVDEKFGQLGGTRLCEVGLGDDFKCLEDDFVAWRTELTRCLQESLDLSEDVMIDPDVARDYSTVCPVPDVPAGTPSSPAVVETVVVDQAHPFPAQVRSWKELHSEKSGRSCISVVFKTSGHRSLRYSAGDHLGVVARSGSDLVTEVLQLLGKKADSFIRLVGEDVDDEDDEHNMARRRVQTLFTGCAVTLHDAFGRYADISGVVSKKVLKVLAWYAPDGPEKDELASMGKSDTDAGRALFRSKIVDQGAILADVLRWYGSATAKVDVGHLLESLPRLQPRYYSISSSPKYLSDGAVGITFIHTSYVSASGRRVNGVCTSWLRDILMESKGTDDLLAPIFVRKSQFRLPRHLSVPVIMIGPGTGLAPFMGFITDRAGDMAKSEYSGRVFGDMHLYFGCRHPEEDYIYQQELEDFKEEGVITSLRVAFSRAQAEKVYVQHLVLKDGEVLGRLICEQKAHVYICGDGQRMARDVQDALVKIVGDHRGVSEVEAEGYLGEMHKSRRLALDVW